MNSTEGLYFSDENTTGFLKPYKGGEFAFAAFLPDEGVTISQYVAAMSAAKWKNLFDKSTPVAVKCTLPAFSYDFELEASPLLKEMGMPAAFDGEKADFSGLLPDAYIGEVIHKTRIEVDAAGTKAAAVTGIGMRCESAGARGIRRAAGSAVCLCDRRYGKQLPAVSGRGHPSPAK